jgi:hypothetical protein
MISLYVIGLFLLALISVYALIQSKTNRLVTFVLIPVALIISLYSWQVVKALQGTPIIGLPMNIESRVIYIHNEKPNILFLVQEKSEEYQMPRYYSIPWTESNAQEAEKMKRKGQQGIPVDGQFKAKDGGGDEESFEFSDIDQRSSPIPKNHSLDSLGGNITAGEPTHVPTP